MKARILSIIKTQRISLAGLHDKLRAEGFDLADIYSEIGSLYREKKIYFADELINYTALSFQRQLAIK